MSRRRFRAVHIIGRLRAVEASQKNDIILRLLHLLSKSFFTAN